jgi:hypothetical protein
MKTPPIKTKAKITTKNDLRRIILKEHELCSGKESLEKIPWEAMHGSTQEALQHLLDGQTKLRQRYQDHLTESAKHKRKHKMTFALDGRLVGDIGELMAAETFQLDLLGTKSKNVDAVMPGRSGKKVQIKATFKEESLCIKHGADYFIGIQLNSAGEYRVIYNGKAGPVIDYLRMPKAKGHKGRKGAGARLEPISLGTWAILNLNVNEKDRVPPRTP